MIGSSAPRRRRSKSQVSKDMHEKNDDVLARLDRRGFSARFGTALKDRGNQ